MSDDNIVELRTHHFERAVEEYRKAFETETDVVKRVELAHTIMLIENLIGRMKQYESPST